MFPSYFIEQRGEKYIEKAKMEVSSLVVFFFSSYINVFCPYRFFHESCRIRAETDMRRKMSETT